MSMRHVWQCEPSSTSGARNPCVPPLPRSRGATQPSLKLANGHALSTAAVRHPTVIETAAHRTPAPKSPPPKTKLRVWDCIAQWEQTARARKVRVSIHFEGNSALPLSPRAGCVHTALSNSLVPRIECEVVSAGKGHRIYIATSMIAHIVGE
jgi:hypothetical protein